jgi:two-component system, NtrC family, response regulator AtoC
MSVLDSLFAVRTEFVLVVTELHSSRQRRIAFRGQRCVSTHAHFLFMAEKFQSVLEAPAETSLVSGRGAAIQALHALIAEIAPTDIAILLVGESGTGRDTYARFIHRTSRIAHAPFKKISCAVLDSTHMLRQVQDFLQSNAGGCMFLDGVEELDLPSQRALASLLPDDASDAPPTANVRLICSTSVNLERSIDAGRFRRELYFRINGALLRLPPLRERPEDIPALVAHFLTRYASPARALPVLDHESLELLAAHAWPGNIRELENIVKKIAALADPRSALSELRVPPPLAYARAEKTGEHRASSLKVAARAASRRTERELILKALERTHWNRKRAAQELQISYKSLLYKIKQIQVPGPGPEEL